MDSQAAQVSAPFSPTGSLMTPTVGPSGFPSQRRTLARACIDYILQSGPAGRVGRPWVGERLWAEQAVLERSGSLVDTRSAQTLCLDTLSPEEVQSSLALSDATLRRFRSWASKYLLGDFKVLYVAEGGNQTERRQGVLAIVREIVEEAEIGSLVLCGHVDEDIFRRLRPFQPVLLQDVGEDSGFLLEELTYLCAHECTALSAIGEDEFTTLFSFLRPDGGEARGTHWTCSTYPSKEDSSQRLKLARQCLQAGAGERVQSLLADRDLGDEADLYLALGHLQCSELRATQYYYERLKNSGFLLPPNIESLIQSRLRQRESEPPRSFALNELDLKLRPYLGEEPGIFIEAGGNDGISQSNTLYFERYHRWRGILVEGIPDLAAKCLINRPRAWVENCALVPFGFNEPHISMTYCNLMSVVDGAMKTPEEEAAHIATGEKVQQLQRYQVDVRTRTLSSVIESYGAPKIDLLSLDVEGFELQVLQGLDLERHGPTWMLIEARYRDEIDAFVSSHYEVVDELSHHDVLYRRRGK